MLNVKDYWRILQEMILEFFFFSGVPTSQTPSRRSSEFGIDQEENSLSLLIIISYMRTNWFIIIYSLFFDVQYIMYSFVRPMVSFVNTFYILFVVSCALSFGIIVNALGTIYCTVFMKHGVSICQSIIENLLNNLF